MDWLGKSRHLIHLICYCVPLSEFCAIQCVIYNLKVFRLSESTTNDLRVINYFDPLVSLSLSYLQLHNYIVTNLK